MIVDSGGSGGDGGSGGGVIPGKLYLNFKMNSGPATSIISDADVSGHLHLGMVGAGRTRRHRPSSPNDWRSTSHCVCVNNENIYNYCHTSIYPPRQFTLSRYLRYGGIP